MGVFGPGDLRESFFSGSTHHGNPTVTALYPDHGSTDELFSPQKLQLEFIVQL